MFQVEAPLSVKTEAKNGVVTQIIKISFIKDKKLKDYREMFKPAVTYQIMPFHRTRRQRV